MKKGESITIQLYGHDAGCQERDCPCQGRHQVRAKVIDVLKDGFVRAELEDKTHPLALVDGKPRIITCGPEMYEGLE